MQLQCVTSFARDEEMGHVFSLPQTIMLPFSSARVGRRPRGALAGAGQPLAGDRKSLARFIYQPMRSTAMSSATRLEVERMRRGSLSSG
mmetsp:Transcript_51465/g.135253  ORF Transcript_51465/g.135253 Transcript_51465/m.135253 type:complete len:89 (+) Transcript_51465:134-400(+)